MLDNKKILYFEGAGWAGADTSTESGVGNCRIRTRIRNKDGRLIYLEMSGIKYKGKIIPNYAKGYNITGMVDHCFYCDSEWDKRMNSSIDLNLENMKYEYNKENILKLVNENLDCDFTDIEVINDTSIRVHGTDNALSDCSLEGYEPFKEIKINIDELKDVEPLARHKRHNQVHYKINNNSIVKLIPNIVKRYEEEQRKIQESDGVVIIRYNNENIIVSCEISCSYGHIDFHVEKLKDIIKAIKNYKN